VLWCWGWGEKAEEEGEGTEDGEAVLGNLG
jgi:hypothetical protein